jgi:hypothetical protein
MTNDCKRNRTTTVFAALNMLEVRQHKIEVVLGPGHGHMQAPLFFYLVTIESQMAIVAPVFLGKGSRGRFRAR